MAQKEEKKKKKRDTVGEFYKLIKQEHNGRNSHNVTKEKKKKLKWTRPQMSQAA